MSGDLPSVLDCAEALADALTDVSPADDLIVEPFMVFSPGGSCIDIYPADPAEGHSAFGAASRMHWFIVRLRTMTSDDFGNQEFLYNARNPTGQESVRAALNSVTGDGIEGILIADTSPSGFQLYEDTPGSGVLRYVGEEWRVGVYVGEGTGT